MMIPRRSASGSPLKDGLGAEEVAAEVVAEVEAEDEAEVQARVDARLDRREGAEGVCRHFDFVFGIIGGNMRLQE